MAAMSAGGFSMRYTHVLCGLVLTGGLIVAGGVRGGTPTNLDTPPAPTQEQKEKTLLDHLETAHKTMEGIHQFLDNHKPEHEELRKKTYQGLDEAMKSLQEEIDAYKKDHPDVK
jgi:hypothetical protein